MPDGKLRYYYWHAFSLLVEFSHLLNSTHPDHRVPDEDLIVFGEHLTATLVFVDESRLIVRASLEASADVREYDYAYVYLDADGKRVFQYDDSPHHPEVSTHPHHMHKGRVPVEEKDEAHELDIPQVDFSTVLRKVVNQYLVEGQ